MTAEESRARRRLQDIEFIALWTGATLAATVLEFVLRRVIGWTPPYDSLTAVVQALVLTSFGSWRWWWVPATIGGSLLWSQVITVGFARFGATAWVYLWQLRFITALPQWLVLRRFGRRSLAWILVTFVSPWIFRIVSAEFARASAVPRAAELAPLVISTLISALLQAAVLAWILAPELGRAAAPAPADEGERGAPPQVWSVRIVLVLAIGLAVLVFLPQLFVRSYSRPDPRLVAPMLVVMVPWVLALLVLSRRRFVHTGLALAASASMLALLPMLPLAFLAFISAPMSADQGLSVLSMMGAPILLVILAVLSTRGALKVAPSARSIWSCRRPSSAARSTWPSSCRTSDAAERVPRKGAE